MTVADVLGVRREPGRPSADAVAEAVGGRSLLVVLDNCEHLIGACAKLADALLRGCPNLALLATSREPLGIGGERVCRVPSLGIPADGDDAEAIRACEAVRLLEDRAGQHGVTLAWDPEAAQIAGRICRRLDGIPLAVELAATRLRVMPPADLDARLDQRFALLTGGLRTAPPRQQTLRAMVDWSWELLTGAEQAVVGPDQAAWLDRLDAELGNLRAAIASSLAQADPGPGLRLVGSLGTYWRARGHAAEGADALRALLDAPAAQEATLPRARALAAAANLLQQTGSYATAREYCEQALAIARAVGDDELAGEALYVQAWVRLRQGERGAALPLIESGLGLARRLGEPHLTANLLSARAHAAYAAGDQAGAARDAAQALRLFRQAGDRQHVATLLGSLGNYELSAGDLDAARRHLTETLDIFPELRHRDGIVYQAFNLGLAEYLGGSPAAAEALFAQSFDLAGRSGIKAIAAYALIGLALARHGGADPGRSARLHGAADQALADLGRILEPLEARLAGLDRQRLRDVMGAEAFDAEYAAGRALDPARVAHEARPGGQAEHGRQRAGALASDPDATGSGEAASVLTPRELDVLKLVAQGLSNSDIARRLVLSEYTVHRHLANILRKLGLSCRAAAAAWGVCTGLV